MNRAFILLFAGVLAACTPPSPPAPKAPQPPPAPVSGIEIGHFDPAAAPQDDFFRYVNGLWLERTEIPTDRSAYGSFFVLRDLSESQLKALVDRLSPQTAVTDHERKLAELYASFMDEARAEALGLKPLEAEFARIEALSDAAPLPDLVARLQRLGVPVLFNAYIDQDAKDASRYAVYLTQAGLGLPDRDYYLLNERKFRELRDAYQTHVAKMLTLAGDAEGEAHAEAILELETRLARRQKTRVEDRDREKAYNPATVETLGEEYPRFGWKDYLARAGFAGESQLIVRQPRYFASLGNTLRDTELDTLKHYLRWHLLRQSAPFLSRAFADEHFDFNSRVLNGIPEQRPRWKRGIALLEEAMGEALGELYVARHFPPENRARMQALVGNLLDAYRESFTSLDWMGEQTRAKALEKLGSFSPKIGYPDRWRDYTRLSVRRDDLLGNVFEARAFEFDRERAKLGKPVDRNEWGMTPQTVNAYYNPGKNEIVFPAGILQPPFFNMAADDAVNYGAIGAVIGHEIGHGFDDQGSKYDANGNLDSWWTREDRRKFEARAARLIEQYSEFEALPGEYVNGALSIGENLADLGGVTIAYRAWQRSLGGKPSQVLDGLTGEQRFFIGWAQAWRMKYREAALLNMLKTGPHSPAQFRCNGVLANLPEFHAAFGIGQGDAMFKTAKEQVKVW